MTTDTAFGRVATWAVLAMLVANFFFAVVDSSSKWLLTLGYAALQLAFFRYFSQFAVTSALLILRGVGGLRLAAPLMPKLILRATLLVSSTMCNFIALKYLSLTVTSAIMFSSPILVCALSWPLLGERVGPYRWVAVAFGFAGVLVVIRPFDADLNAAAFLMLAAAFGLALYSIMTRKLVADVAPLTMQFILGLTGTVVLFPFAWAYWVPPEGLGHLVLMLSLGCFAWFGHELLIRAHQVAEANYLMPYSYSYLIYMSAFGYILFADLPDRWTVLGALMISASGLVIWWRELQLARGKPAGSLR